MIDFLRVVEEILADDLRYKPDSYEFVAQALHFTQKRMKRKGHITGRELLEGIREFALEQYGPMAKAVLNHWGITKTEDFGNIVFNLIEKGLFARTAADSRDDFKDVYDLETALSNALSKSCSQRASKKSLQSKN